MLLTELAKVNFNTNIVDVQNYWNSMEQNLVQLADLVAPMEEFVDNQTTEKMPQIIRQKINLRKRLLQKLKQNGSEYCVYLVST